MPLQPKLLAIVVPCLRVPFYAFSAHVCQRQAGQSADYRLGLCATIPIPILVPYPVPSAALNCLLCRPKLHSASCCVVLCCAPASCLVLWHAINLCIAFGFGGYWCYALHLPDPRHRPSAETAARGPVGNCDCRPREECNHK